MRSIPSSNSLVYYRLIALWVLCEAMLGGIIHGFRIPVSGLVVGSCAIICICLIAWYAPQKGSIIKATLIVAIFKMMLSPQAPAFAYIAVFFQGMLGEILFWRRRYFQLSCMLLAVLALLESGLQRILVLTIVYGNDLWKVVNDFFNKLTGQANPTNYSLWIGAGYVLIHLLMGIFVGWWSGLLPLKIEKWSRNPVYKVDFQVPDEVSLPMAERKRKKRWRSWVFIIWILLVALYVQSYFKMGTPILPAHISLKILLRSVIIVLAWVFIIGPVIKLLLHRWLQRKKSEQQPEIQKVLALLPSTQELIKQCWKKTSHDSGFKRLRQASRRILVNALAPGGPKTWILTAPIQSGKTTALGEWVKTKAHVHGILTPVVEGKRHFHNINTGERFQMEAMEMNEETLLVGRFSFSRLHFDKAIAVIRESIPAKGWLVIDEIGPLELKGEGFSQVLKQAMAERTENILLVVREGLTGQVIAYFDIGDAIIISDPSKLPTE